MIYKYKFKLYKTMYKHYDNITMFIVHVFVSWVDVGVFSNIFNLITLLGQIKCPWSPLIHYYTI